MGYKLWQPEEEEYFEKAWNSGAYDRNTLTRIFDRSWTALINKAKRMGLETWETIDARTRVAAIERALKEDHVI